MPDSAALPVFDFAQVLPPFGFRLPARMSALPFGARRLALVSPVPIDAALAGQIAALGEVDYLIAPNLLHSMYLAAAARRFPQAKVLGPPGLLAKRPELALHATLDAGLPEALASAVELVRIEGAPATDEFVFCHRATRTLVVTDLVFNMLRPQGWFAHLMLFLGGTHGRLAPSRAWRFMIKDRAAAAASVERVLALPFETLVMAHGEIVREDARARLAAALHWLRAPRGLLVASG